MPMVYVGANDGCCTRSSIQRQADAGKEPGTEGSFTAAIPG
jgi:hypothetical protein